MLNKHNSLMRWLAGLLGILALAASGPSEVAASNGFAAPVIHAAASLHWAALRAVDGSVEIARDLRSLYSIYQLQTAPEIVPAVKATRTTTETVPRMILCDLFQNAPSADSKKESRI